MTREEFDAHYKSKYELEPYDEIYERKVQRALVQGSSTYGETIDDLLVDYNATHPNKEHVDVRSLLSRLTS